MRIYVAINIAIFIVPCAMLSTGTTSQTVQEVFASSGLDVYVSLFNDGGQPVKICVFTVAESAGCQTYSPSDYNLHRLGPFTFSPGAVPVGESFTACASIAGVSDICSNGLNGEENTPERVTIKIPSDGGQQQAIGSQGGGVITSAPPSRGINWLQVCRNPIVDAALVEPCESLTTPDGYSLTSEGTRVLACVLGAGVLLAYDTTGVTLAEVQALAKAAGLCG